MSNACGAADEAREPAEAVGVSEQAATAPTITWFRWTKGDPVRRMERVSTHVCGLSMVRGEFARDTDLFIRQGTGFWEMLANFPGSNLLQADAVCVPLSAFRVNAGQVVSNGSMFSADLPNRFNATVTRAMTPNSAGILTRVKGAFNGKPERAWVETPYTNPTVNIKNGTAPGTHTASAFSLNFGLTGNLVPKASVTSLSIDGHAISWTEGVDCPFGPICDEGVRLDAAFCHLSSVSGDFNGAEEWAQVFPFHERGRWHFNVHAGGGTLGFGSASVYAEMTCLNYDQTRGSIPIIR